MATIQVMRIKIIIQKDGDTAFMYQLTLQTNLTMETIRRIRILSFPIIFIIHSGEGTSLIVQLPPAQQLHRKFCIRRVNFSFNTTSVVLKCPIVQPKPKSTVYRENV